MAMRPSAPYALLLATASLAGCGVPDPPAIVTQQPAKSVATTTTPTTTPEPKKAEPAKESKGKPTSPPPKAAEQDPAKLGEGIVDTKVGTGPAAEPGDTCTMLYAGRLKSNGTEFDSNTKPGGKPFVFTLGSGSVIKGWDVGVKGMKVGGKRTLTIPSALGYGAQGGGDKIPPNSDLVFDIQLLDLQKASDATTVTRTVVTPGAGPAAKTGDVVTIKYKGSLVDGTVFDSTDGPGRKPFQFKVGGGQVIPGMDLAVTGMKKGETVQVKIPPALGYGPMGQGQAIPPNSTLKFEITLVSIG